MVEYMGYVVKQRALGGESASNSADSEALWKNEGSDDSHTFGYEM